MHTHIPMHSWQSAHAHAYTRTQVLLQELGGRRRCTERSPAALAPHSLQGAQASTSQGQQQQQQQQEVGGHQVEYGVKQEGQHLANQQLPEGVGSQPAQGAVPPVFGQQPARSQQLPRPRLRQRPPRSGPRRRPSGSSANGRSRSGARKPSGAAAAAAAVLTGLSGQTPRSLQGGAYGMEGAAGGEWQPSAAATANATVGAAVPAVCEPQGVHASLGSGTAAQANPGDNGLGAAPAHEQQPLMPQPPPLVRFQLSGAKRPPPTADAAATPVGVPITAVPTPATLSTAPFHTPAPMSTSSVPAGSGWGHRREGGVGGATAGSLSGSRVLLAHQTEEQQQATRNSQRSRRATQRFCPDAEALRAQHAHDTAALGGAANVVPQPPPGAADPPLLPRPKIRITTPAARMKKASLASGPAVPLPPAAAPGAPPDAQTRPVPRPPAPSGMSLTPAALAASLPAEDGSDGQPK